MGHHVSIVLLKIALDAAKTKERAWIHTKNQKKKQKTTAQGSISTGNPLLLERIPSFRFRFSTDDAMDKYDRYIRKQHLIMEMGFTYVFKAGSMNYPTGYRPQHTSESNQLEWSYITQVIKTHKWETLCQNPSPVSDPIVREFYANYDAARPDVVYVRGKLIDASPSGINSLFSLTNHQNTLFDDVSNLSPLAMSDIVYELTGIRKGIPFHEHGLTRSQKIWKSFIDYKLFPSLVRVNVGTEVAILLYCIMFGKPINVGKVIAEQIQDCASQNYLGGLLFPALITRLCERHNVLPAFCEPNQHPYSPYCIGFDKRTVNHEPAEREPSQQTNPSNQETSHLDHNPSFLVTNTGHQSRDDFGSDANLSAPAEAAENSPPNIDSSQKSPLRTAQATSSQSLPPVAPSVLPAEPLSLPQTYSVELQSNSSRTIPPFRFRFPTDDAVKKHDVYTRKQDLLMERWFICSKSNKIELPHITQVIKTHKWETFCQKPSSASIPIVREFYANYDAAKPDVVYVRGKLVDASPSAINSIFSLTNHQSTLFDDVSKISPLAMSDIVDELTTRKVKDGNYYEPFSRYDLKKLPKIWKSFTERNLFPFQEKDFVGKEMAILLYCIMVGKPINVGKVIAQKIRECASLKSGLLWFPALITRLCEKHNALPALDEPLQKYYSPICFDFVKRTVNYELVKSEPGQQTSLSNQQTSQSDHQSPDVFGRGQNLPAPAEATVNAPPHFDLYEHSPPPLPPSAPPAKLSSLPQTDSIELQIGLNTAKTKERAWINTEFQKKKQKTTTQGSISTGNPQPPETISSFRFRFPTDDAMDKYDRYTRKQYLIMERRLACSISNQLQWLHINLVIKTHEWEFFCQKPSPASIPLVREFYANYDAARPDVVYVRGKLVDASPSAINSLFYLTGHQNTLFDDVSKVSPHAMNNILYTLTGRKVFVAVGEYYRPFHQSNLNKGSEIWKSFTETNLFPSLLSVNVGKEMAILLYCIMAGKPINVGKVIAEQIQVCASQNYVGGLFFPALITRLCERHNVLPAFCEPNQHPYPPYCIGFDKQTVDHEPVESEPGEQRNPSNQQTSHLDHDPSFSVANTGRQSRNDFGSGPNLHAPAEAAVNAPPHFDLYEHSPPPTSQATFSPPLPPVAPSAPAAKLSCLPQTDSDKLPIHVPGLPILAEAAEKSPPTAQAISSQSLSPVELSVLPAEPLSLPQTDSGELQVASPQCGTICVQGYNVKWSVAPILEAIFKKHGDIAAECQFKTASVRSSFLEVVCEVVTRIETNDVIDKMEELECQVSDADGANINVSWLRGHLEAIHKRKEVKKRSDLLMETKISTSLVKRAAHMDLRESCEELVAAQERFEKAERCARVLYLVENNLKNAISESKAENSLLSKDRIL